MTDTKLLCAFSPDQTQSANSLAFASVTQDNRLQIWSAADSSELRQTLSESDHLTQQYTALAFGASSSQKKAKGKKSKKRASTSPTSSLIALGTQQGAIVVWDVTLGEIKFRMAQAHSLEVTGLAFCPASEALFSVSLDKQICQWSTRTGQLVKKWSGGQHGLTAVCVSKSGARLAVASAAIRVFDVASAQPLKSLTGHANPTRTLAFADKANDDVLVSSAGDRFVSVWDADPSNKRRQATHTLACDSIPTSVACRTFQSSVRVLAISNSSVVHVWDVESSAKAKKSKSKSKEMKARAADAQIRIRCKQSALQKSGPITQAVFAGDRDLLVSRRTGVTPVFARISYLSSDAEFIAKTQLDAMSQSSLLDTNGNQQTNKKRKLADGSASSVILGAADTAIALPHSADIQPAKATGAELTLAEKLEQHAARKKRALLGQAPSADSMVSVLSQALQSDDQQLLEYCLTAQHRGSVIPNTVDKLKPTLILPFVRLLVKKLETKPNRAGRLLPWLRAILARHMSYLISIPDLPQALRSLHQTVEARTGTFPRLLQLQGRLEMILAQADSVVAADESAAASNGPEFTVVEGVDDVASSDDENDVEDGENGNNSSDSDSSDSDEEMANSKPQQNGVGSSSDSSSDDDESSSSDSD